MSSLNRRKVLVLKDPRFGATNFLSNFIFPSYLLVYPEIVMCLANTSKKCEFWRPHLRGTPIVVLPNFIFSYLPILKISSVQGEWFSFEFWRPCLRGISSFSYPQILSNFIFFCFCLS